MWLFEVLTGGKKVRRSASHAGTAKIRKMLTGTRSRKATGGKPTNRTSHSRRRITVGGGEESR
jgi:hypothetical protein